MFQDLKDAKQIAIDIETYDPDLRIKGCGARRNGYICGIAIATDTGVREYFSVEHEGDNLDKNQVYNYLASELNHRADVEILGANLLYDLEYLVEVGIKPKGKITDILLAEPLIDENQYIYSLDECAKKYLGESKKIDILADRCKELGLKGDPRAHIYKFEAEFVRSYAIGDVDLPLRIWQKQKEIITSENLQEVWDIERRLVPLLLQMKRTGCRIDVRATQQLKYELLTTREDLLKQLKKFGLTAGTTDFDKANLARFFDVNGLPYPRTPKTNKPSFKREDLENISRPEIKMICEVWEIDKVLSTFVDKQLEFVTPDGRIHAQFNQLRGEGGAVTGRCSSSKPNLQNVPKSGTKYGQRCRGLFIPEDGELFGSIDYSQIEYRILCHFAIGGGSKEIREAFAQNPKLDVHQWCADAAGLQGKEGRKKAKEINFGIIYGQGVAKTAQALGISTEEAKEFLLNYNKKMPFAKETANTAMNRANARGWVRTILGRRRRFNMWEPAKYSEQKEAPLNFDDAKAKWGNNIKRAGTYKALNAIVQGSSADLMKLVMVKAYEDGIFNAITPLTTVHDELNASVPDTVQGKEGFDNLIHIMQNTYKFKVPILVDAHLGPNWSDAKG